MRTLPVPAVSCLGLLILSSCLLADCRFIPEAWSACTVTCGVGTQVRIVRCQVLLSFSQSVADLPVDECEGPKPASQRPCYAGPCNGEVPEFNPEETGGLFGGLQDFDQLYDWEYEGFTKCSESCGGGKKGDLAQILATGLSFFCNFSLCLQLCHVIASSPRMVSRGRKPF